MTEIDLDARGLLCPLPVLKLRKRLQSLAPGACLNLLADDPMAEIDVPHFCTENGHALLETRAEHGARLYVVRKGTPQD
ncbi:sulfurtransferase TusA family protein [Aquicoccus sp. G2-2]|uniref:sulfurtransferase TusA family protein n=1 Tax=Aquicoccus sp. G2-2 TaxID=3092120 RepID=UPI002ADF16DD|nr:sulfurtransferase TusA family protein [Aquicoccus sp. G2-2]MEA1113061.1 sulfurtransferase TusA family protein [Aquicoccus sp. G2-2]